MRHKKILEGLLIASLVGLGSELMVDSIPVLDNKGEIKYEQKEVVSNAYDQFRFGALLFNIGFSYGSLVMYRVSRNQKTP